MSAPSVPEQPVGGVRLAAALVAVFLSGCVVALQSRVTGELGQRLGDGFLAALISFGSGLVILLVAVLVWRPGRQGIPRVLGALRQGRIPWWYAIGGAGGALFVISQGVTVGVLGVALFTIAVVCGQAVMSLAVDHRGFGSMRRTPATPLRIAGAALAIVAVGIAIWGQIRADAPYLALILPLLAGVAVGWQQGANGQIRAVAGSALTAALVNFVVGTTVVILAVVVHSAIAGLRVDLPSEPWLYIGGVLGVYFIAFQAFIVRTTGVLLLGLAVLAGQLAASVAFDLVAPVEGRQLTLPTVIGTILTFVAVVIAVGPRRIRIRRQRDVR